MEYVITDGKQYLHSDDSHKLMKTDSLGLAERYTYDAAQKVIKNYVPKFQRPFLRVEPVDTDNINVDCKFSKETESIMLSKTIFDNMDYDWKRVGSDMKDFITQLPQYKQNLQIKYKEIEEEQNDFLHYIEDVKFDVFRGFKALLLIQDIRKRRRKIKDELLIAGIFLGATLEDYASGRCLARLNGLDNRKYRPRRLIELFKNIA